MAGQRPLGLLGEVLVRAISVLNELGVPFAVVGGLAVAARSRPRTTKDVDFAVAVADDKIAQGIVFRLQQQGYRVLSVLEQEMTARLATVRLAALVRESTIVVVDLLFGTCGIESEVIRGASAVELVPGITAPVASTGALLAMKILSNDDVRRPDDRSDIIALLAAATTHDLLAARDLLDLIETRGYARGKDLRAEAAKWLPAGPPTA